MTEERIYPLEQFEKYKKLVDNERLKKFYFEFQDFWGKYLGDAFDISDGYDLWFINNVFKPEQKKNLIEKICEISSKKTGLLNKIKKELTPETKKELMNFYNNHNDNENNNFDTLINYEYIKSCLENELRYDVFAAEDINRTITKYVTDQKLYLESIKQLIETIKEDSSTLIDVFENNREIFEDTREKFIEQEIEGN